MERLRHALEVFRVDASTGFRVKRTMDYELFHPDTKHENYTATVKLTTKTTYVSGPAKPTTRPDSPPPSKELPKPEDLNHQDPFALPGENPATQITPKDLEAIKPKQTPIVDPVIVPQQLQEQVECRMEYRNDKWRVLNPKEIESVQVLFDYALQQGEYGPR